MKLYSRDELEAILANHRAWLEGDESGVRADLQGADLRGAFLRGADLRDAFLQGAFLRGADLQGADLRGAFLQGAFLRGADLQGADLRGAFLRGADLQGADLQGASGLNGVAAAMTEIVPRKGSFSGWKKADIISNRGFAGKCVVELRITEDAARSNASGRKCRCSKADVVSITDINGEHFKEASSNHDPSFVYRVGETVEVPDFCEDRWAECAAGIHFFMTPEEAWAW